MADSVSKRYISLPHVVALITSTLVLYGNLQVWDNRSTVIASGKMSHLVVAGTAAGTGGTPALVNGFSLLGAGNLRDVNFHIDGICVAGSDGDIDCVKTTGKCGDSSPTSSQTKPCFIPYHDKNLEVISDCTKVKVAGVQTTAGAEIDNTNTKLIDPAELAISNIEITPAANKFAGLACRIAGCNGETLPAAGVTTETACNKPSATAPTTSNAQITTAGTLPNMKLGFTYKQGTAGSFSINVLKAKNGGDTSSKDTQGKLAINTFKVRDYVHDYSDFKVNMPIFYVVSAGVMFLGACLVLLVKPWTRGKYGGDQLGPIGGMHPYWPSSLLDAGHGVFLVLNIVFSVMGGQKFAQTIEGSIGDPLVQRLLWGSSLTLLIGQAWVTLHAGAFLYQWATKPERVTDPYNKGVELTMGKLVVGDHGLEQRASMVRNNLNV